MNIPNEFVQASWITPFSSQGKQIFGAAYDKEFLICPKSLRDSPISQYRHADKSHLLPNDLTLVENIEEPCLYLGHYFNAYGHFLLETLPMISVIMNPNYRDWKFFFLPFDCPPEAHKLLMQVLDVLELSEQKKNVLIYHGQKIVNGSFYIVPRPIQMYFSVNDILPYQVVISKLKKIAATVVPSINYGDRIFLCRNNNRVDSQFASEVEKLCHRKNFHLIRAEKLSFIEQVAIMSRAKVIAGFEGSNLHNAIFGNSDAVVIEFGDKRLPHRLNPCQKLVSQIVGSELKFIPYMTDNLEQMLDSFLPKKTLIDTTEKNQKTITKLTDYAALKMNPYQNLPDTAFWKLAVANKSLFDVDNVWNPKFNLLPQHKVVTFGSCFAQHIGKALTERGFTWVNTELPPPVFSKENCKKFNYNIFSCRTGNIYTTSLLKQWVEWTLNVTTPPAEYWKKESRVYDPFRPAIEPNGFVSIEEMKLSREHTIKAFKKAIQEADCFVFTLGLTESWMNKTYGYEYPMCPGTIAGVFNQDEHIFKNQQFNLIFENLTSAIKMLREINKDLKFILTVSPVPLTATNSGNHVLVATMESKSILRTVAGQLAASQEYPYVDYFPSYELINSPFFRGTFFEPNQRSVTPYGVNFVMDSFFSCLENKFGKATIEVEKNDMEILKNHNDIVCEEELLAAFGKVLV